MNRLLKAISPLAAIVMSIVMMGCDPHQNEGPAAVVRHDLTIDLSFSTPLPLFREITYGSRDANAQDEAYAMRYLVRAYPAGSTDDAQAQQFTFTRAIDNQWDCSLPVTLAEGTYDIYVWADFVDADSAADKYYATADFANILLAEPYQGNIDYRDAFSGTYRGLCVGSSTDSVDIPMVRPLAQYRFIASDIQVFVERELARIESAGLSLDTFNALYGAATLATNPSAPRSESAPLTSFEPYVVDGLDLSQYRVQFFYTGYLPNVFDIFSDKPIDSTTGVSFDSFISRSDSSDEAVMGFDYVFVNGQESAIQVAMQVFSPDGELVCLTAEIQVPITRSKLTLVRGNFLTQNTGSGVGIDPECDGTFVVRY